MAVEEEEEEEAMGPRRWRSLRRWVPESREGGGRWFLVAMARRPLAADAFCVGWRHRVPF